jgi:HAMP domain-containing protein
LLLIYRFLIAFYPAQFRAVFAAEMVLVFREAVAASRHAGLICRWIFVFREYAALVTGAIRERVASSFASPSYMCAVASQSSTEVEELEQRVAHLVQQMQHAIAHHDFAKAREYSNKEQVARRSLNALRANAVSQLNQRYV